MLHKKYSFAVILSGLSFGAAAQQDEYFRISKFEDPRINYVTAIQKDTNNFIWLSTQDGIYRFDGKNFKKVLIRDKEGRAINSSAGRMLVVNRRLNQVFTALTNKGIAALNTTSDQQYFQLIGMPGIEGNNEITSVIMLGDKYLVTTVNGVYCYNINTTDRRELYKASLLSKQDTIHPLLHCPLTGGSFAVLDKKKRVFVYQLDKYGTITLSKEIRLDLLPPSANEFFSFTHKNGCFYLGTSSGLFIIGTGHDGAIKNFLPGQPVYAVVSDPGDNCYIAASNGLFKLTPQHKISRITGNTALEDDPLSSVYSLFADNENIWLGSQDGLSLFRQKETPFYPITHTTTGNQLLNHAYHINQDRLGEIVISAENGLFMLSEKEITKHLPGNTFFLNFPGPDGRLVLSGLNKTYVLQKDKLVPIENVYPEFKAFGYLSFNDYKYIADKTACLSTENEKGVFIWDQAGKKVQRLEQYLGLPTAINQINALYKYNSSLFILTDSVFFEYTGKNLVRRQLIDPTGSDRIYGLLFDMLRINDHYYFTSYDNGVIETDVAFKVIKTYNTNNGLSNNGVYRMLTAGDSLLFISSNNGINVLDLKKGHIHILNQEDGLHGNVFEEFSSLKAGNRLYFGGKGGVSVIDVSKFSFDNRPNNLRFISYKTVTDENETREVDILGTTKFIIPNNVTQTIIEFQNVIFPFNNKGKYAYKISELHKNWIELGNTNFVTLIGLAPGTYHMQVRTANEDGIWSDPKELTLVFLPKWYQTWWFQLLVAFTVAGIIYAFYRYRIRQIKKQHEIRRSIASDLHDDLGSTLNSVKVFTNLAISGIKQEESLQQVKDNLNEATMGLRDMLWVLDDSLDTVDELVTRLKQYAIPVAAAGNMEASIKAESEANNRKLTKEEKRNLFLVCKEAINNSIKYSSASQVNVHITTAGKKIRIVISDNGKGFAIEDVQKGYGLKNMQYRAEQIKYRATLTSSPGNGTQIIIEPR